VHDRSGRLGQDCPLQLVVDEQARSATTLDGPASMPRDAGVGPGENNDIAVPGRGRKRGRPFSPRARGMDRCGGASGRRSLSLGQRWAMPVGNSLLKPGPLLHRVWTR
jgi:hypothetical protein